MATRVYDKATQKIVEVDNAEAQRGIQQGQYDPADDVVSVRRGRHEIGDVNATDLATALAQGWELSDAQEHAQIQIAREESGIVGNVQGAAETLAAGASLGLSTAALESLGVDPERMAARREGLDGGAPLLEVVGGVAATLGTGGGSLAARGALGTAGRAVAAPSRLVSRLGAGAETAVQGALGTGRAGRLVGSTIRGGIEGYAAGAGARVDENVLGNREQVAEEILIDSGGLGMFLGGTLGAGLPIAADAAAGIAKVPVSATRKVLGRAVDAPGGEAGAAVAREAMSTAPTWRETAAEKLGSAAERTAFLSDVSPDAAGNVFRKVVKNPQRMSDIMARKGQIEEAASQVVGEKLNFTRGVLDDARILSQGANKYRRIEREFGAQGTPRRALTETIAPRRAEELRARLADRIDSLEAEGVMSGGALREARKLTDRTFQRMAASPKAAGAYEAMDALKRDLVPLIENTGGFSGRPMVGGTTDLVTTNKELRKIYGEIRDHLEDETLWGKGALVQRDINAKWSLAAAARAEFRNEASGSGLSRIFNQDGSINARQALSIVRQFRRMGGEQVANKLDEVLEAEIDYLRTINKHYELPEDAARRISDAEQAVEDLRRTMKEQAEDAADLQDVMELRGGEGGNSPSIGITSNLGTAVGGVLGSAIGGPVGTVAGMFAGTIMRPYTAARGLASILAMVDRVGAMRSSATAGTLSKILGGAGKKIDAAAQALGKVPKKSIAPIVYASAKEREDRIHRARKEAAVLATRPDVLQERVQRQMMVVDDVAPGVGSAAGEVAQRAAMYLAENAPRVYSPPFGKPLVDPLSASQYLRRVEAIEQPIETLARLNDGSLTVEHVDALDAVYPQTMTAVRSEILEALSVANAEEREIPFDARLAVGVILGIPTDAALQPQTLAAIQAALGDQGQEPAVPQPKGGVRAAGASSIDSDRLMTPAQRVESGVARA